MARSEDPLVVTLFGEMLAADQLLRNQLSRVLPKGMELSHFSVLNHLAQIGDERSPAELAQRFNLSRGAMTNTLGRLEWAGHIHIRPDWEDARRKFVSISPAGRSACEAAIASMQPVLSRAAADLSDDRLRSAIGVLREMRGRITPS
ncbi:MAG: MarR family transcriptional regulator [Pseudomonadota bacterium]